MEDLAQMSARTMSCTNISKTIHILNGSYYSSTSPADVMESSENEGG